MVERLAASGVPQLHRCGETDDALWDERDQAFEFTAANGVTSLSHAVFKKCGGPAGWVRVAN
jgi:hypothetical protein